MTSYVFGEFVPVPTVAMGKSERVCSNHRLRRFSLVASLLSSASQSGVVRPRVGSSGLIYRSSS